MFIKLYLILDYIIDLKVHNLINLYIFMQGQHPAISVNLQRLIRSCNNIVIDGNFLENMDSSKIEELDPPMCDDTTRYRETNTQKLS